MDTVNLLGPLLLCAFPLVGAIVALFIERKSPKLASYVTTGAIAASCATAIAIAFMGGFFSTSPADVAKLHNDINKVPRAEVQIYNETGEWPVTDASIATKLDINEARVAAARDNQPVTWMEADQVVEDSTISVYGIRMGIHIDHLAMAMLLMVTLASTLIHVFSMGYMAGDPRFGAFFRWIGFFTFSMLGLLISDNLLSLYVCWELMGLSSYKLIGFFYHKESAQEAAKKAFMTTRVGDVGMFLGILLIYATVGSVRYTDIFDAVAAGTITDSIAMWASIGLFFGAVGKSAQFPLHVWLPDAMEGPTPVSALIHAATMVAAGVYLVARMFPLFEVHPFVLPAVAVVGTFTALFAGTIAVAATDIKKVLAYSTVSQLGFMFAGLGAGGILGYYAGTFHLINHAFFKACLFLGSGSVIHAVHTQEIGQMGGLWKKLPMTFITWMVATLAIAGVPFTSGFFSKDAILLSLTSGWDYELAGHGFLDPMGQTIPALIRMACMQGLVVGAFLTAAYMWRVTSLTFFGKPREQSRYDHAHESPLLWGPLVVLAVMAIASGYIWDNFLRPEQVSGFGYYPQYAAEALAEGFTEVELAAYTLFKTRYDHWHHLLMFVAIPAGLGGLAVGFFFYNTAAGDKVRGLVRGPAEKLFWVLKNKYFIDEIYWKTFVAGSNLLALFLAWWDREVVDGFVRAVGRYGLRLGDLSGWADREIVDGQFAMGAAKGAYGMGKVVAKMQNGRVRVYLYQAVLTMAVLALVVAAVHG